MARMDVRRKAASEADVDLLREGLRVLMQELREVEVAAHLGAER